MVKDEQRSYSCRSTRVILNFTHQHHLASLDINESMVRLYSMKNSLSESLSTLLDNSNVYVIKNSFDEYVTFFSTVSQSEDSPLQDLTSFHVETHRKQKHASRFYSSDGPVIADLLNGNCIDELTFRAVKLIEKDNSW